MTGISRRRLIVLTGIGAAAVASGATARLVAADGGRARIDGPAFEPTGNALAQPDVLESRDGRLAVTLTAAPGVRLAGRATRGFGYNGTSPGPTLRVRPGDELAVRLVNRLDQPTNLHTHGLRVSPEGNGDNPFVRVDPGTSFDYAIRIPDDHPPGTHWYHPHHHGLVADQVFGGLVGAILVDGETSVPVADDRVLIVTDTTLDPDGGVVGPGPMERAAGRQGELLLLNGRHRPEIPVRPGALQRWRIVNACAARFLDLRLEGHQLLQIALDGTYLRAPADRVGVQLAPGNRADVLVRPSSPGRFALVAQPVDRGGMGMGMMAHGGPAATSGPETLATMVTTGTPVTALALPETLPAEAVGDEPVGLRREVEFQMGMGAGAGMGMTFAIDGRTYGHDRTDQTVDLGSIEEWTITNPGPGVHPFHLHVWPFTVLASSDGATPSGVPQDVVPVPARGWVRLRIPFTKLAGRSVYHCHILDHEDAGMMATIDVRA